MLNSAHEALKVVGIDCLAKKEVNKLSGGQKQLVAMQGLL
jgi:ABC-type cobalamin/Fe3+-siderophores transport system ATPase subunit